MVPVIAVTKSNLVNAGVTSAQVVRQEDNEKLDGEVECPIVRGTLPPSQKG